MKERAYKLLKEWCDTLLTYQVRTKTPYTDGALLCPACHIIHGRIADLCFPFTVLWDKTGDESYLEEADRLIDWSEYNLVSHDGLWYNDITGRWFGTSAFSAMAIGEALIRFRDRLPKKYTEKWLKIFVRMSDTVASLDKKEKFDPVSNYYCGFATELAMAWLITGDKKYHEKSKYWISAVLERIDDEGLLYGERYPMNNADGSHTVDMGYSLEESIPLLLRYSELTGEYKEEFRKMLRDHLEFLLPDGAIDNSFGSRHDKWTYWGSRTSDGLIEGLALVLDDQMFADACERVLTLYERCTHDGLLAMPMAHETGEPTCLHHTFTHAKALASLVCADNVPTDIERTKLPCEEKKGIREYQNGKLLTVSHGDFRATFSAVDTDFFPPCLCNSGGSLNLLYHDRYGVICAATSAEYSPMEQLNQQYLRKVPDPPCMTAQFVIDGKMACTDKNVSLSSDPATVTITAKGDKWRASYTFKSSELMISLASENGTYRIPIVCSKKDKVVLSEDKTSLSFENGLTLISSAPLDVDVNERFLHQVGGLLYVPISVKVEGEVRLLLK